MTIPAALLEIEVEECRKRVRELMAEHHRRVAQFTKENEEFFNSEKCQSQLHPAPECLEWDQDQLAPRVSDVEWDRNQANAEGWGNQVMPEKSA